jgi:mannose-6-phosphate isomerase-like protein (cupin superfamily)
MYYTRKREENVLNIDTEVFFKENIEKTISSLNNISETIEDDNKIQIKKQANRIKMVYEKVVHDNKVEKKPWGQFKVLCKCDEYQIKELKVLPNHRLSLQKHLKRSEHWFVLQGSARVTLNNQIVYLFRNDSLNIPVETVHRIENIDSDELVLIETQTGSYFGEDDIIRLADDFGRFKA